MNEKNSGPIIAIAVIGLALLGLFNDGNESTGSLIGSSIREQQPVKTVYEEKITEPETNQKQSEYYGLVKIQSGFGFGSDDPRKEYLTLTASSKLDSALNITPWTLRSSSTRKSITLGKATSLYYTENVTEKSDIVIEPGGKAIVVTGISPVGVSFRANLCTGYLNQFNTFTPSLTYICPLA
ncbi:MAG: hypothetical protein KAR00_02155, partial [Candidatus Pacebacteria bacterium]|nr:hypothetical protein [Candidatus Paceibacterota bacterium]